MTIKKKVIYINFFNLLKIYTIYLKSKNDLPSDAGTTLLFLDNLPEIIVNAIIVAMYGIIESNWEAIGQPRACPTNWAIVIPPKIRAPTIIRHGIQEANTTKASAIQPLPAVIPSDQWGVKTKGI